MDSFKRVEQQIVMYREWERITAYRRKATAAQASGRPLWGRGSR